MLVLPTALYRLFNENGELLYVGISWMPEDRFKAHAKERRWWQEVARRELTWFEEREEAKAAEKTAIRVEKPRYNTCHTPRHARISNKDLTDAERAHWEWARSQDGYPAARDTEAEE